MRKTKALFFVFIFMMTSHLFAGTVYYIDGARGNDSNNGQSLGTAWKTIGKANATLRAGDTVYIRTGTYLENSYATINPANSGSPGNFITYQNYNGEKAVITGTYHGVYLGAGKDYIKVDGITIDGVSQETSSLALFVRIFSSHNIIQNCTMQYLKIDSDWQKGIYIEPGGSYNRILNNSIQYVGHAQPPYAYDDGEGIWIEGSYTLVEGNHVDFCGHGAITYAGTGNVIRNNEFRGQWGRAVGLGGLNPGSHNLMELNTIRDARGTDEGMFPNAGVQVNGFNHIFRKNFVYDHDGDGFHFYSRTGYSIEHVRMYHNVIINCGRARDADWGYGVDFTEHDNGTITDVVFKNNIFNKNYRDGVNYRELSNPADYTVTNNHWNADGDPGFVDENNRDFRLRAGSSCIDKGAFLTRMRFSGTGIQLSVEDAGYFCDGFGIVEGDLIQLQGQSESARIVGVDYGANVITVNRTLTWNSGQGISLAYSGSAPDLGAFEFIVANPVVVNISASPTSGLVPLAVNFTGNASGGTAPYTYSWNFGDGQSSTQQNPSHTYSAAGNYTAIFTVNDSQGATASKTLNITASAASVSLTAAASASPASGQVPLAVDFTGSASGGTPPYAYSWNFGDGSSSTQQNPAHTYSSAGDFTAILAVTDSKNNREIASVMIYASDPYIVPNFSCLPQGLSFGATNSGQKTSDQYFRIMRSGGGTLSWNVEDNANWLTCLPNSGMNDGKVKVTISPSGLSAGTYTAVITVTSPGALHPSQSVNVTLRVTNGDGAPFGCLDTPVDGSSVSGSLSISGWALDDIEVTRVEIKRNSTPDDPPGTIGPDGLVYIDDAAFIEGARPDIEKAFPDFPLNVRAGWGYMLLTNVLPNRGNGPFSLAAFAHDASGRRVEIGRKTIHCNNDNQAKPFGTIDSPKAGESISGSSYLNFGWVLTPLPKTVPKDGSTISVWVDGVQLGHPVYNQYREDIARQFPEFNNSQGAVGYYYLDTTQYRNGVHTIGWSVVDDQGQAEGIGSRFFSIDNNESGIYAREAPGAKFFFPEDKTGKLRIRLKEIRRGFRLQVDEKKSFTGEGVREVQLEQMEPGRIVFEGGGGSRNITYIGWEENAEKDLPAGSMLDQEKGIFSWMPPPGFIGKYLLHFVATDGVHMSKPIQVLVNVIPPKKDTGYLR